MEEYFVIANSFAAPFFSDTSEEYVKGENPLEALQNFIEHYKHPCGLFSANLYASADDYHKNKERLAHYYSNFVITKEKLTKGKGGYSFLHGFEDGKEFMSVNGEKHFLDNSKGGECFLK